MMVGLLSSRAPRLISSDQSAGLVLQLCISMQHKKEIASTLDVAALVQYR